MSAGTRPRRRTSGRGLRRLLITIVVLAGLALVADRGACLVAEREAASKFQSSQQLPTRPSVTIKGFPFLTQVLHRELTDVRVSADGLVLRRSGRAVRITHLVAELHGIRPSKDLTSATANSGAGTATIGYHDLSQTTGVSMSYAGDGRLKATQTVTILGQPLSGSVIASLAVHDNQVQVTGTTAQFDGTTVPQQATDAILALVNQPISFAGLPAGLTITAVTATPNGLVATLTARNVTISRP